MEELKYISGVNRKHNARKCIHKQKLLKKRKSNDICHCSLYIKYQEDIKSNMDCNGVKCNRLLADQHLHQFTQPTFSFSWISGHNSFSLYFMQRWYKVFICVVFSFYSMQSLLAALFSAYNDKSQFTTCFTWWMLMK